MNLQCFTCEPSALLDLFCFLEVSHSGMPSFSFECLQTSFASMDIIYFFVHFQSVCVFVGTLEAQAIYQHCYLQVSGEGKPSVTFRLH